MHGGGSTGPKTAEGIARVRAARWKHGEHSASAKASRAALRAFIRQTRDLIKTVNEQF